MSRTVAQGIRAFLRNETALGLNEGDDPPFVDTGVLIVNRNSNDRDSFGRDPQIALLHADFGLAGERGQQRSTISVTIGDVRYDQPNPQTENVPGIPASNDEVLVRGHTFGSSRDNRLPTGGGENQLRPASTFFTSELFNTAAGGGNPDLNTGVDADGDGELDPRPGRVGYLVLENFEPEPQDGGPPRRGDGGTEDPLDPLDPLAAPRPERPYALLRLGTGTGSLGAATGPGDVSPGTVNRSPERSTPRRLVGYAAGLGEFQQQTAVGVTFVDAGIPDPRDREASLAPNLELHTTPSTNRVVGVLNLTGVQTGNQTIYMGGPSEETSTATSAFVDDDTFATRTHLKDQDNFGQYALITGPILTERVEVTDPRTGELRPEHKVGDLEVTIPEYQHVRWGFFFGERMVTGPEGHQVREHVHLGTWTAGVLPEDMDWKGTAVYEGHAIGNVFDGESNSLSTVVGRYTNAWNFDTRRGDVDMSFDGTDYSGTTRLANGSPGFVGGLRSADRRRVGRLDGTFVGPNTEVDVRTRVPEGLVGQFSIGNANRTDPVYRASGTVGAERRR